MKYSKTKCLLGNEEHSPSESRSVGVPKIKMDLFAILCKCTGWEPVIRRPKEFEAGGVSIAGKWVPMENVVLVCTIGGFQVKVLFEPYPPGYMFRVDFDGDPSKLEEFKDIAEGLESVAFLTGFFTEKKFAPIRRDLAKHLF